MGAYVTGGRLAVVVVLAILPGAAQGQDGAGAPQAKKGVVDEKAIGALIAQLGDESFEKRQQADKELAGVGRPALPLLRKAAKESADAEVRERAESLIQQINKRPGPGAVYPEAGVFDIAVSKNGQTFAVACGDNAVRIYDWKTNAVRQTLRGHTTRVWSVAFSPDGLKLASCSGEYQESPEPGEIIIWDLAKGTAETKLAGNRGTFGVTYSLDGTVLYSCGWDRTVKVWDLASGKEKASMKGHEGPVRRVILMPDGKSIASTSMDGYVRVWNPRTLQEERQLLAHAGGIGAAAFSPDGKWLVTGTRPSAQPDPGEIKVWDMATFTERATIKGPSRRVVGLAVSPDSTLLAMSGGMNASFGEVKIFDLATGAERATFRDHKEWVECVTFSPDGKWLLSGGGYSRGVPGEIRIWDAKGLVARED
ncbi:MAG TPA: hypothetical protein VNX28_03380 [Gemmataceae bacterium]|jgi:WD40 repeat protein|nr:hypothetical protein [Gemmataceae bacterium]